MEPSYYFSTTLKGKIFFHFIILKHQNTKTAAYMLSKNHWVRPFFAFFRFVREILFVTVALDHPVSLLYRVLSLVYRVLSLFYQPPTSWAIHHFPIFATINQKQIFVNLNAVASGEDCVHHLTVRRTPSHNTK